MPKLLIVESPGKVDTLRKFLGPGWVVAASYGHVRDLPKNSIGVAPPNFIPQYEPTERGRSTLAKLAKLARDAEEVYLATDADREGEGISWHLKEALGLKDPKRITFTSITKKAVLDAVSAPRKIDNHLVAAQGGRRILDRLVGYMASRPLSDVTGEAMSAGRVQSPAVRLVVERERAIAAFKVSSFYEAILRFALPGDSPENPQAWVAKWDPELPKQAGEHCTDKTRAAQASGVRDVEILGFKEGTAKRAPPAPFTTSTFQQAAYNQLKLTPEQAMQIAQQLYEQGLITYMRTDSTALSAEALADIAKAISARGFNAVNPPRVWQSKEGAQEAHEAIRPTHIENETAGTTKEAQDVYAMIRQRTLACQMEDAVYATRSAQLRGTCPDGSTAKFIANGRTLTSAGWLMVMNGDAATADATATAEADNPVPILTVGKTIRASSGQLLEKKTKPPARYNQASLVRELESEGIGRPSTYASIMNTIRQHGYVEEKAGKLAATPKAAKAVDALIAAGMSFIDLGFTKAMETKLDEVANGQLTYRELIRAFHAQLEQELQSLIRAASPGVPACPVCGRAMRKIAMPGKSPFYGCTGYPVCKKTMPAGSAPAAQKPQASAPAKPLAPPPPPPQRARKK